MNGDGAILNALPVLLDRGSGNGGVQLTWLTGRAVEVLARGGSLNDLYRLHLGLTPKVRLRVFCASAEEAGGVKALMDDSARHLKRQDAAMRRAVHGDPPWEEMQR